MRFTLQLNYLPLHDPWRWRHFTFVFILKIRLYIEVSFIPLKEKTINRYKKSRVILN